MKRYVEITNVERCYLCPFVVMETEDKRDVLTRTWRCLKTDKVICVGILRLSDRKYEEKPIIHQDGWFPEWCPLEDVE